MQKLIFGVFLFVGISLNLFAQQISVVSFERLDNDLDARVHYPVKDQNGDVCALIKIETTQTGFAFEGGSLGITKIERKTGEYWVYIPWGSIRMTIKHDQLGVLRDYAFSEKIEKATVYVMKLSTGKVTTIVEEPEIQTQWVLILSDFEGAQVYIDEKPVGNIPFTGEFSLGQHTYRVVLPMYHPDAGMFTLDGSKDKITINAVLRPNFGSISVNSTPETGADVLLDGKPTGKKTPCTFTEISSKKHRITVQKDMFYDAWQEVNVEDEKTITATLSMNPAYGEIEISTNPFSDIYINGSKIGSGTYSLRKPSGFYTIEARKDKHTPDSKKIEVSDGQTIPVMLSPVPQHGVLKVNSSPPQADIYINGEKNGTTPTTIRQLLVGDYNLELKLHGYCNHSSTFTIKHNETTEINPNLQMGKEISINSSPSGVLLEIDSEFAGRTPYTGNLNLGKHQIKLINNTRTLNETIEISENGKSSWSFNVNEINEKPATKLEDVALTTTKTTTQPKQTPTPKTKYKKKRTPVKNFINHFAGNEDRHEMFSGFHLRGGVSVTDITKYDNILSPDYSLGVFYNNSKYFPIELDLVIDFGEDHFSTFNIGLNSCYFITKRFSFDYGIGYQISNLVARDNNYFYKLGCSIMIDANAFGGLKYSYIRSFNDAYPIATHNVSYVFGQTPTLTIFSVLLIAALAVLAA